MRLTGQIPRTAIVILLVVAASAYTNETKLIKKKPVVFEEISLYEQLSLAKIGLKESVFKKALRGLEKLKTGHSLNKPEIISIADLSQSANNKRLYVIDLESKTILFHTYVSHGRRSGEEFACSFGNKPESYKTSLGYYETGNTYNGKHGLSMRLKGLEPDINHFAEQRGIVMHGANYVSESFIEKNGRLGRSQGCPAVPDELCIPIINSIKEGSCFFVFYPDSGYFRKSAFWQ